MAEDSTEICIAVDAMGGDYGPDINVRGAAAALGLSNALKILLVGEKEALQWSLKRCHLEPSERLQLVHAEETISMEDHGAAVARKKKNSSIHVGLRMVKEGKAQAFLSAGNSGAVMASALLVLGRLPGVERPCIVIKLPTAEGFSILLDAGANVDCKPEHLLQFAQMGDIYARLVEGIETPRVGLLSNASESHKGNESTRAANELLQKDTHIKYIGSVEGFDLFQSRADVIVCDGFVGNVVLKSVEGLADTCFRWFRREIKKDLLGILGVFLLKRLLRKFKQKFDYQPYGAAPLLGIDGLVLICHGSSTELAIQNGILTAEKAAQQGFVGRMGQHYMAKSG